MQPLQCAIPVPEHEVDMGGAFGRQILWQGLPLASGRQHIENRVKNFANVDRPPPAAPSCGRDKRRDKRLFGIVQITRISKAATIRGKAMFGFPHLTIPCESNIRKGITTDSSDSISSWIGSKAEVASRDSNAVA